MPYSFELPAALSKIGFSLGFIANSFLIYLTVFHIKRVFPTYKRMIVYFATSGILFSGLELVARPFAHNYNGSILFFSTSTFNIADDIRQFLISAWAGFYSLVVSFIAVQFVYRYVCLFYDKQSNKFDGVYSILWMLYSLIPGSIYCGVFYLFCLPDDYADDYLKLEIFKNYQLKVTDLPRFVIVPYNSDGSLRMKNLWLVIADVFSINFHYSVMLFCGLKLHFNMKKELKKFSVPKRRLQRQFFYALVAQSVGPTVFLILPAAVILMCPLLGPIFNFEISWKTGWLYSIVGLYPPFDSVAMMMIVTEYRKVIRNQLRTLFSSKPQKNAALSTTTESVVLNAQYNKRTLLSIHN
ncbi:hypothetical protein CAEBREN_21782 [Caenorhabditis brenneri]|uniref:Seven TM Receptor n=1 Tax=Caenorhabditis brenneri TaxID=135651 RepID=G0NMX6_CAEBE|nr:hypothetical protein CAEBREN_21782 [Caenorhabditis brenneri]